MITVTRVGGGWSLPSAALASVPGAGKSITVSLPSFKHPPVAEVALAVQFDALPLRAVDLRVVFDAFADAYPVVEQHPARSPMTLDPGPVAVQLIEMEAPELPLLWFGREDRLIQFQVDRLVVNWRRRPDEEEAVRPYPRYSTTVRPMLEDAWGRLVRALAALNLEPPRPNVCEVLYVNPIETGDAWQSFGELDRVIAPWSGAYSESFLPPPTDVQFVLRYDMNPGWLNVQGSPVRRTIDGRRALMLQLSARGPAKSGDLEGALAFLDRGREWIVQGFTALTTPEMHAIWGREDA